MIKTDKQAIAVQQKRAKAGKRGYSKAVRRHFLKHHEREYSSRVKSLPVYW